MVVVRRQNVFVCRGNGRKRERIYSFLKSLGRIYLCPGENDLIDAILPYSSFDSHGRLCYDSAKANLHDRPKVSATARAATNLCKS